MISDLNVFRIDFKDFSLKRFDFSDKRQVKSLLKLRDKTARRMCYDVKMEINNAKNNTSVGNPFVIEKDNDYIGYMFISDEYENRVRVLSLIINKRCRNKGYGGVILTDVSSYLLSNNLASQVELYIKHENISSRCVAIKSGFKFDREFKNSDLFTKK